MALEGGAHVRDSIEDYADLLVRDKGAVLADPMPTLTIFLGREVLALGSDSWSTTHSK